MLPCCHTPHIPSRNPRPRTAVPASRPSSSQYHTITPFRPYCWSYAAEWCAKRPALVEAGVAGPLFVSIGDAGKLNKFLDLNPSIRRSDAFVDDYSFAAYEGAGFKSMDMANTDAAKEAAKSLKPPGLDMQTWFKYLTNVASLSPIPGQMKFGEIPEGVMRLGGTFVVDADNVVFQWSDKIPGDYPDVEDVVRTALQR